MAVVVRSERAPVVRSRVHADGGALARPMVKTTAGVVIADRRPHLTVVPRRRRTAHLVAIAGFLVAGLMLGAVALQTQLAERQVAIDRLDRQIRAAQEQFDVLRAQRAELLSPVRLGAAAEQMGMHPAHDQQFMTISPDVVAAVQRSAGDTFTDTTPVAVDDDVFDQFQAVKSVEGG